MPYMEWYFPVQKHYYEMLERGEKEVEGRVPDYSKKEKDYRSLAPGDIAVFYAVDDELHPLENRKELRFEVAYNLLYPSVEDMVEKEGLSRVLPDVSSLDEAVRLYHGLPGYEERIGNNGIHAIGLVSLLNENDDEK